MGCGKNPQRRWVLDADLSAAFDRIDHSHLLAELDRSILILLTKQNGRCALCQGLLLHADHEPQSPTEWEQWHRVTRKAITKNAIAHTDRATPDDTRLVHSHCQRRTTGTRKDPALLYA